MIELVSDFRCIRCDICVRVCPTNVFEAVPDAAPIIARKDDCQTCFMCELYCPTDALFVAPDADASVGVNEPGLSQAGVLGSYREAVGWSDKKREGASADATFRVLSLPVPQRTPITST